MKSFNLIDEEWIPCLLLNGETKDLSLRDTIEMAPQIREIFSPSPLITASLQRLLMAVLWRVFRMEELRQWKDLWRVGSFDRKVTGEYLDQWHHRFNLLDENRPFYQLSTLELSKRTPLKRLGWEYAVGNNGTLFDHSSDDVLSAVDPADAARWVVTTQCFAASSGKSETIHTKDSPWSRGAILFLQGDNLFQTLTLNLLGLLRNDFPTSREDQPVWEREAEWEHAHSLIPLGIFEYLTWQSRSIKLLMDQNGDLKECYFAQGRAVVESFKQEPAYVYKKDAKLGYLPWQFDEGRVLWRDSHTLFNLAKDSSYALPESLQRLGQLTREMSIDRKHLYQLQVLGQSLETGQPTIRFWRNERLPLRPEYLDNKPLLDALREAVDLSEKYFSSLMASTYLLARLLLEFTTNRQPDKKDVRNLANHWQVDSIYWSQLEAPFSKLLIELPADESESDEEDRQYGQRVMPEWTSWLERAAKSAFLVAANGVDGSSRGLKALAKAESSFAANVKKLAVGDCQESR
jgi:CRISPR system Cascade subunit CasA